MSTIAWAVVLIAIMIGAGTFGWTLGAMFPSKTSGNSIMSESKVPDYKQLSSTAKNTLSKSSDTGTENNQKPGISKSSNVQTSDNLDTKSNTNTQPSFSYSSATH